MSDPYYDGPVVVVSGRVAALLCRPLRKLLLKARDDGARLDDDVLATVAAIERAGRAYTSGRLAASDDGTPKRPMTAAASPSDMHGWFSTSAVADRLGCTERNVRRLIASERLASTRVGRAHLIDPAELARHLEDSRQDN